MFPRAADLSCGLSGEDSLFCDLSCDAAFAAGVSRESVDSVAALRTESVWGLSIWVDCALSASPGMVGGDIAFVVGSLDN